MTTAQQQDPNDEMDELLPWLATGTLTPHDAKRVTDALRADSELERRFRLVREELAETIGANERLPPPPARTLDRLFEKIDAEPARPITTRGFDPGPILPRVIAWIGGLTPRTLTTAAAAAAAVFLVQGALITGLWVSSEEGTYVVMSEPATSGEGAFLFVKFAPSVSAADLAAFLRARNASIVDGPQPNGFFRVKVADAPLSPEELDRVAAGLKTNPPIVEFTLRAR